MKKESLILTREIITHIMGNIGFVTSSNFGLAGASRKEFILDKNLIIENEDSKKQKYKIWGASTVYNGNKFRLLFTNLTNEDGVIDYFMTLRVDKNPIHAMNLSWYEDNPSNYYIYFDKNTDIKKEYLENYKIPEIVEASTYDKCMALAGIEIVTQGGVDWSPIDDYDDLYNALTRMVGT